MPSKISELSGTTLDRAVAQLLLPFKVKPVASLEGPALDWAVAKCRGDDFDGDIFLDIHACGRHNYSSDWLLGGPIIAQMKIATEHGGDAFDAWVAKIKPGLPDDDEWVGPTPLIAALRCYVARQLGPVIEVPGELLPPAPTNAGPAL